MSGGYSGGVWGYVGGSLEEALNEIEGGEEEIRKPRKQTKSSPIWAKVEWNSTWHLPDPSYLPEKAMSLTGKPKKSPNIFQKQIKHIQNTNDD